MKIKLKLTLIRIVVWVVANVHIGIADYTKMVQFCQCSFFFTLPRNLSILIV